jgi:hypothetical protein
MSLRIVAASAAPFADRVRGIRWRRDGSFPSAHVASGGIRGLAGGMWRSARNVQVGDEEEGSGGAALANWSRGAKRQTADLDGRPQTCEHSSMDAHAVPPNRPVRPGSGNLSETGVLFLSSLWTGSVSLIGASGNGFLMLGFVVRIMLTSWGVPKGGPSTKSVHLVKQFTS